MTRRTVDPWEAFFADVDYQALPGWLQVGIDDLQAAGEAPPVLTYAARREDGKYVGKRGWDREGYDTPQKTYLKAGPAKSDITHRGLKGASVVTFAALPAVIQPYYNQEKP